MFRELIVVYMTLSPIKNFVDLIYLKIRMELAMVVLCAVSLNFRIRGVSNQEDIIQKILTHHKKLFLLFKM